MLPRTSLIYTSKSQWGPITNNTPEFGDPPLWYAHYDDNPSFSDFAALGDGYAHQLNNFKVHQLFVVLELTKTFIKLRYVIVVYKIDFFV